MLIGKYRFKQSVDIIFYIPLLCGIVFLVVGIVTLSSTPLYIAIVDLIWGLLYSVFFMSNPFDYVIDLYKDYFLIEGVEEEIQQINIPFKIDFSRLRRELILDDGLNQISIFYNNKLLIFLILVSSGINRRNG